MTINFIEIVVLVGLVIIFGAYQIVSKRPQAKLPRIPLGLLVLFFILKIIIPIFQSANLGSTADSIDVTSAIVLWMAIIRIVVYFVVDFFLRQRKKLAIPTITRDFALAIMYVIVAMIVLKHKTNVNLGSLLTTSAILTAVIGFAMQDTLGNLFSGLALQLEHPYQIGDWIGFEGIVGKVEGITWKSTKILTGSEELIFVPNNTIAKSMLKNYSRPTIRHQAFIEVGASYEAPPHKVKEAILSIVKSHPKVLAEPKPEVRVIKYDNSSINYKAVFSTEDFAAEERTKSEILNGIWYKFGRENVKIPYPIQEQIELKPLDIKEAEELQRKKIEIDTADLFSKVDIFKNLTEDNKNWLAKRVSLLQFAANEKIVEQGGASGPMYVIKEGKCSVLVSDVTNADHEVASLGPTQIFGEMSVLTGAPRTATVKAATDVVCYEIDKSDMKDLFVMNSDAFNKVSEILIERKMALAAHKTKMEEAHSTKAEEQRQLINKIKSFLGF